MKPLDFVVFNGGSDPNLPAYKLEEAMYEKVQILTNLGPAEVLSYYYHNGQMHLDLEIIK